MTLRPRSAPTTRPSTLIAASTPAALSPRRPARIWPPPPGPARQLRLSWAALWRLLQERQDLRKPEAELDAYRREFAAGDKVLLDTEHTPLPSRSLLLPRWMGGIMGPFKVLACTAPNTYRLDVPATWR